MPRGAFSDEGWGRVALSPRLKLSCLEKSKDSMKIKTNDGLVLFC